MPLLKVYKVKWIRPNYKNRVDTVLRELIEFESSFTSTDLYVSNNDIFIFVERLLTEYKSLYFKIPRFRRDTLLYHNIQHPQDTFLYVLKLILGLKRKFNFRLFSYNEFKEIAFATLFHETIDWWLNENEGYKLLSELASNLNIRIIKVTKILKLTGYKFRLKFYLNKLESQDTSLSQIKLYWQALLLQIADFLQTINKAYIKRVHIMLEDDYVEIQPAIASLAYEGILLRPNILSNTNWIDWPDGLYSKQDKLNWLQDQLSKNNIKKALSNFYLPNFVNYRSLVMGRDFWDNLAGPLVNYGFNILV